MKRLFNSFKFAIQGVLYTLNSQWNMRIHFIIATLVIILGILYDITSIEWVLLLLTIGMVITSEMINTAIEKTIDLVTEEYNILAKISKDVAAGAVFISALIAFVIGIIIFHDKII